MPSGLTCKIKDGQTFENFVWTCARQFGALILMRDDPADAPIPETFEPSDYYIKAIAELRTEQKRISAMNDEEAEAAAYADFQKTQKAWDEREEERNSTRVKYEEMRARVNEWVPPTADHQALKSLMLDQIKQSLDWDCDGTFDHAPERVPGPQWKARKLAKIADDLEYHQKEHLKEVKRTDERNAWIKALRDSVPLSQSIGASR